MKVKVLTNENCKKYFDESFTLADNSKCIRKKKGARFETVSAPVLITEKCSVCQNLGNNRILFEFETFYVNLIFVSICFITA